jgi:hypothetical protein
MKKRILPDISSLYTKKRDAFYEVQRFIDSDTCFEGKILVLYGLRRTGKTTLMEQVAAESGKKYAFYEVEDDDTMKDIEAAIEKEQEDGTKLICLDEVTNCADFISLSASLPDIFAKEGMRIIVAGTDSLGFAFAEEELCDRTVRVNTTHIPFAEHCSVLGTNDIDDYIEYGGLMRKGTAGKYIHDYKSACKYLDVAVTGNIIESLKKSEKDSPLEMLSYRELCTIIEKLVEKYSGSFDRKVIQNELKTVSVNFLTHKLPEYGELSDDTAVHRLLGQTAEITRDFTRQINADHAIKTLITPEMIEDLIYYLDLMQEVSATTKITFRYDKNLGWRSREEKEYYIIQPAIKYYHLQKGKEFVEDGPYYEGLTAGEREFLKQKLDEKIKGDMAEQIVLFDTKNDIPKEKYEIVKPEFFVDGQKKGEYDMLIWDKQENRYWGFEIKHASLPCREQERHLQDEFLKEVVDRNYGRLEKVCVLYKGESFLSSTGTYYLNLSDFAKEVHRERDMEKVLEKLTRNLPMHETDFAEEKAWPEKEI